MERFRVALEGIDLDDEQTAAMQAAIEKAVLSQVACLDTGGDLGAAVFKSPARKPAKGEASTAATPPSPFIHWDWCGIVVIFQNLQSFDRVNEVASKISVAEFRAPSKQL